MNIVCEVCGHIGFKQLLIRCRDCKDSAAHPYCFNKVMFNASFGDWLCFECQQKSGEVSCRGSLVTVSSERPSHANSGSTLQQPIANRVESAMDAGPCINGNLKSGMTKYASVNKLSSSEMSSLPKKHIRKKSNVRTTGNRTIRKGCNTIAKRLRSSETIGTETTKNSNGKKRQVDDETSVFKQPTPLTVNCLGYTLGDKAMEGLDRNSKRTPKSHRSQFKGLLKKTNHKVLGTNSKPFSTTTVHGNSVLENGGANLSSEHTDQDNQANQPTSVGCKIMEVESGKDSKKVVSALEDKYWAAASLRNKSEAHNDSASNVMDGLTPGKEKEVVRFQLDYRARDELQQSSMAASVTQRSTPQDDALDKVMPCSPNMCTKETIENQNMPSEHIENQNSKENQNEQSNLSSEHIDNQSGKGNQSEPSNLFHRVYLSSSLETYPAKFLPEDSTAEVEISVDFGKDNPRKRRHLILLDEDDDEEKTEDVHLENVNPLSQNCDTPKKDNKVEGTVQAGDLSNSNVSNGGSVKKRRRYADANEDEDEEAHKVEETVHAGHLSDSDANNGGPVKKRRRYIDASGDEDEEAIIDVLNTSFAENDVANNALNDGANLESQPAVAEEHFSQSRIGSDSDTADQQYYIYSRPIDELVWSGAFKINGEIFGKLDAHLSNKACEKVWDLSRMLQPVVEVMKIPRWQAWPKRWTSAAPTDDCIGLFFFPRSSRPNEESNKLVNVIIESDDALKVTIGAAELLIFPSTLLSEHNQLFQGKYYLWGVFKRRKDQSDRGVLAEEQDGVACATEESKLQEHHVRCESSGQETSVVKHVVHDENEIMVERNCVAQKVAMEIAEREGITLPDSKLPYDKPNSPEDGSKCSVHPRIDGEFHAPEEINQHEECLSSPVLNASSVDQSTTECGHGESHSGSGPPTTKLFGLITARTPRAQQLIEEMISEGALVFSVPEQIDGTGSCTCRCSNVGVGSGLNPDIDYRHLREHPQSLDFISKGHGVPDMASESCLELFPVRQENIGWAPRVESTKEVDLDLSLGAHSRPPSVQL